MKISMLITTLNSNHTTTQHPFLCHIFFDFGLWFWDYHGGKENYLHGSIAFFFASAWGGSSPS